MKQPISHAKSPRQRLAKVLGEARLRELEQQASDEWDGVSVDIEPIPLWAAVLCVLALVGILAAVVWAVFFGGRS
jgi:hypothetical protein